MNAPAFLPLARHLPAFEPGQVWLVGAGAGDPGLLTLLALHALQHADVIVHDALVSDEILALAHPQARRAFVGKRGGHPSAHQDDITESLIELARQNLRVVRLKGGDPFVFGRGGEEAARLAEAGVFFRIVPGVTSGLAGLAYAGIPATTRGANRGVILATGHPCAKDEESLDWARLAQTGLPIILYMAMKRLDIIVETMLNDGADPKTPVAIVEEATSPRQRTLVTTLGACREDARAHGCAAPAIVAIGAIVNLREQLQDFLINAGARA